MRVKVFLKNWKNMNMVKAINTTSLRVIWHAKQPLIFEKLFSLEAEGILEECGEALNQRDSHFILKKLSFSWNKWKFRFTIKL